MSERGESFSCGSVSQLGKTASDSAGTQSASERARSSASRVVAVTMSWGETGPPLETEPSADTGPPVETVRRRIDGHSPLIASMVPPVVVGSRKASTSSVTVGFCNVRSSPLSTWQF